MSTTTPTDTVTPDLERLLSEDRLSIAAAAALLGKSYTTVHRWIFSGRRGVRLEAFVLGNGLATTRQALNRFAQALTARRLGLPPAPTATEAQRQRRAARATREFERMRREDARRK